ncbi:hypothetical protein DFH29DRAFT_460271 [Suillus ampliporus]|nr:hypothetical protein DFH29DRAFT_460271 [Suillus ampliporus]
MNQWAHAIMMMSGVRTLSAGSYASWTVFPVNWRRLADPIFCSPYYIYAYLGQIMFSPKWYIAFILACLLQVSIALPLGSLHLWVQLQINLVVEAVVLEPTGETLPFLPAQHPSSPFPAFYVLKTWGIVRHIPHILLTTTPHRLFKAAHHVGSYSSNFFCVYTSVLLS